MTVSRAPSGIPGLDALIEGGIPTTSTIALRAEPCNATEYFQQQFVAEGLKQGMPAIYCCLSRPAATVINGFSHQGFEVVEHIANDQLVILDCYSMHPRTATMGVDKAIHKKIICVTDVDDETKLQDGLATAVERLSSLKNVRTVCENVGGTLTSSSPVELMRWGRRAFADLRAYETLNLHTFPTGVREDLFDVMAHDFDGVMEIRSDRSTERVRYLLHILKLRMTAIPQKVYELDTDAKVMTIRMTQKIT